MRRFSDRTGLRTWSVTGVIAVLALTGCQQIKDVMPDEKPELTAQSVVAGLPGKLREIKRDPRSGIDTEGMDLLPVVREGEVEEGTDREDARVPSLESLTGERSFELFDLNSRQYFEYTVPSAELARFSRARSELPNESDPEGKPVPDDLLEQEDRIQKSWSNKTDNRQRLAIADGFSDQHSIYQRMADYGGCSANVLQATNTRMVAITAGHCIFIAGNNFSSSKLRPRRNGTTSPTWGSWTPYAFAYYSGFLNNDCEDNWNGNDCIRHDIALVFASRDSGATPPRNMGWGYRPKSFLDVHRKYRRGYPGCNNGHSPSPCTTNNLYGDGRLSVGGFSKKAGGWNRQFRFSSDINPGDSGSGLYYYRNGFPYVFGVTSAEPAGCKTSCSSSRPNYGRRITPDFFDFINSVI